MNVSPDYELKPFDLSLVAIMAAANFVVSFYVTPTLTLLIPKVFVGAFLMTPLNLFLAYSTWAVTRKRIFTLYFLVYGLLTMPTTIWGNTPGIFKPLLGGAIGLSLDIMTLKLRPQSKISELILSIIFPLVWWGFTGGMWVAAGLPVVQFFQGMMMGVPILSPIMSQGFVATFASIAVMTMPSSAVATHSAVALSKQLGRIVTIPRVKTMEEVYVGKRNQRQA